MGQLMKTLQQLSDEALEIGFNIIKGSYTDIEFYRMMDRLREICRVIGGSPRELLSNAQLELERGK